MTDWGPLLPHLSLAQLFVNIIDGNNRSYYVMSPCSGPRAWLSTFQTLTYPGVWSIIVPLFRTKTEAPKDGLTCPRSHSKGTAEQDWTHLLVTLKISFSQPSHGSFLAKSLQRNRTISSSQSYSRASSKAAFIQFASFPPLSGWECPITMYSSATFPSRSFRSELSTHFTDEKAEVYIEKVIANPDLPPPLDASVWLSAERTIIPFLW